MSEVECRTLMLGVLKLSVGRFGTRICGCLNMSVNEFGTCVQLRQLQIQREHVETKKDIQFSDGKPKQNVLNDVVCRAQKH